MSMNLVGAAKFVITPDPAEDWTYDLICQQSGVRLAEIGVGVYQVDYPDEWGKEHHAVFSSWPAAEACYVHHVNVEDYR